MYYLTFISIILIAGSALGSTLGLSFQLEAAGYLESAGETYAKLRISIPYDDLLFIKTDDGYAAGYRAKYRITTPDGECVHSGHLYGKVEVSDFSETNEMGLTAREEVRLKLPSGTYDIKVTVEDKESLKRATRKTTLKISFESQGGLQLSSVELHGCNGAMDMLPDTIPSHCSILTVNAELYCLGSEPPETMPLNIQLLNAKEDVFYERTDTFPLTGKITVLELPLSLADLEPGTYQVVLKTGEDGVSSSRNLTVPWSIAAMINEYDDALLLLHYIAERDDVRAFKETEGEETAAFWNDFWRRADPVPSTPRNELMEALEKRIMYANDKFGSFETGWQTDMGMIHVMFGFPDDIERHPFDLDSKPYEIWSYYSLNRRFVFVDRSGFGWYDLVEGDYSRR